MKDMVIRVGSCYSSDYTLSVNKGRMQFDTRIINIRKSFFTVTNTTNDLSTGF